ncbi:hypothetical protein EYF80_046269 [Liparis tanakae]|uniref:Uncharacterized protein n=1 Tax=Liparis tanakae TaxID=230148 RepID=A0A4Z2FQN8_9TELE|nr:hypothetical protein EYF80_046269 [Liparis tanakae]
MDASAVSSSEKDETRLPYHVNMTSRGGEGLEPLLSGPPLVVVAHYQDDVVPVELAHQVEPHVGLVGVGGHRPQEGQVDALGGGAGGGRGEMDMRVVSPTTGMR